MATGIAVGQANLILDALCRSVAYDVTAFFLKLHLADPGAAGTTSPAAHTTRIAPTFSAASGGAITNTRRCHMDIHDAPPKPSSHWSAWDTVGPAGGTFLFSDNLTTPRTVAIGDTFEIPIGDLDIDITILAA